MSLSANGPDPATLFPLAGFERLCFLKNKISRPNILVGDYTYYDDFDSVDNFEKNVRYHFEFVNDKLIIGKFCMIASGVEFIMNGGNHLADAVSAYPFAVFGNGWGHAMDNKSYPVKGDITIGNDVWLGYGSVIMPGVSIGDGAIVATKSVVTKNIPAYTIVGGNPAKEIRKRFSEKEIEILLKIKWWDWPIDKLTRNVHLLTSKDITGLQKAE